MKDWDYEALVDVETGAIYCVECAPGAELSPIFAGDEWSHPPQCEICGHVHDYMTVLEMPHGAANAE